MFALLTLLCPKRYLGDFFVFKPGGKPIEDFFIPTGMAG
jgi:hypothetical protein